MTKSEKLCKEIGELFFYKEMIKSDLLYITNGNQEKELADMLMRVGDNILIIQIKEKENNGSNINKWLERTVYRVAKNQIKATMSEIINNINFKNKNNKDILDNISQCVLYPIIIFDIGDANVDYEKVYYSSTSGLLINIFNINDFKMMCSELVSPTEMTRYINNRMEFVQHKIITHVSNEQLIVGKSSSEKSMIEIYKNMNEFNKHSDIYEKLQQFNYYLSNIEKKSISNKDNYKTFIKYLSNFSASKIYIFMERLQLIIDKGFKKEMYFNSFIYDNDESVLFISLPKDKYDEGFIAFISNIFMRKFKINKLLSIINYAEDPNNYFLGFSILSYDKENDDLYKEALEKDYSTIWNNIIEEKA